ncbi:MAG TPA: methyltransferase domain-containing protein [Sphingobium sp.]|uniref:class I SAM-dependent methyltransferase n=1 Tax=Sphingobium sp. TaxID=1912891 RepID=UPI002ED4B1F9
MTVPSHAYARPRSSAADYIRFLKAWVRQPKQTASIVPSSPWLGRLMAAQIDPQGGSVLELGGGTGALTREILATGLPRDRLEVVEINQQLARELHAAFHGVRIIQHPAESVSDHAKGGAGTYQVVISGLPILALTPQQQQAILAEAFKLLAPGGSFIQFTYSPRSPFRPKVIEELGLGVRRIGTILRNVPPATVFRVTRAGEES